MYGLAASHPERQSLSHAETNTVMAGCMEVEHRASSLLEGLNFVVISPADTPKLANILFPVVRNPPRTQTRQAHRQEMTLNAPRSLQPQSNYIVMESVVTIGKMGKMGASKQTRMHIAS